MINFRQIKAEEIECRIGQVGKSGYSLLLYKDARCDMAILDECVGNERWQRKHEEIKGNMYCSVGILCDMGDQWIWVWKSDCGTESNTEKQKGEASDSFKRACVNWGIGRELYTSPFIFIKCDTIKTEKGYTLPDSEKYRKFKVSAIEYKDGKITALTIVDNNGEVAFKFGYKVLGGDYVLSKGKYAGKKIRDCDDEYLQWCLDNVGVGEELKANIRKYYEDK